MEFRAVKGTRDFYPDEMRLRNWIADAWRRVSLRNGFEEYDAPIFEYLDLFTAKSGQEIAEQLFSLTDRGGRNLAIRPEITPSLARMVNAKINSLPRPIKWFSIPRLCRAENPQKGRLREFFQWNIDVIGEDDVIADAECIFVCADFFREVGLTPADVKIRIGSRALTTLLLEQLEISEERRDAVLAVLDKRAKLSDGDFRKVATDAGITPPQLDVIARYQELPNVQALMHFFDILNWLRAKQVRVSVLPLAMGFAEEAWKGNEISKVDGLTDQELEAVRSVRQADATQNADWVVTGAAADIEKLWNQLAFLGIAKFCELDMRIVRGLAYYTGIVYEAFDAGQSLRAVAGGGRYDNLLEVLGGPKVGATGFGMGDVVLGILLEEKGKLPNLSAASQVYVIDADAEQFPRVLEAVGRLRAADVSAEFSYARRSMNKQFKEASKRGAAAVLIVSADGLEFKPTGGEQKPVANIDEVVKMLKT